MAKGLVFKLSPFFLPNFAIIKAIMDLYEELKERGLVYQVSNEEGVKKLLHKKALLFTPVLTRAPKVCRREIC